MAGEPVKIIFGLFICFGFAASRCPKGWIYFEGQCYFFAHDFKTFNGAERFCVQKGGHLAHVYSNKENKFLVNSLKELVKSVHWIGLTDVVRDGVWKWKHNNKVANFTDWGPSQPNGDKNQNCVAIWPEFDYSWGDIQCSFSGAKPICQKPFSAPGESIVG